MVDHGHPGVMHNAETMTAIGCGSDRDVLDGLVQAVHAHELLFGRFTGHYGRHGLRVCVACHRSSSCGWVGIDHFCSDRVDPESGVRHRS